MMTAYQTPPTGVCDVAGNRKPNPGTRNALWAEVVKQRAQVNACMDAVQKLATMVQVLSQAYGRIIGAAQASAAEEERQRAHGADVTVGETVTEGGIVLGAKQP